MWIALRSFFLKKSRLCFFLRFSSSLKCKLKKKRLHLFEIDFCFRFLPSTHVRLLIELIANSVYIINHYGFERMCLWVLVFLLSFRFTWSLCADVFQHNAIISIFFARLCFTWVQIHSSFNAFHSILMWIFYFPSIYFNTKQSAR